MIQHDVNPIGGTLVLYLAAALVLAGGALAQPDDPCVVEDDGSGTVELPPPGCAYLSPDEVHMIIDGLPPDTTIVLAPIHQDFICRKTGVCGVPGGGLGGEVEDFDSQLIFELTGSGPPPIGDLHRILTIPVGVQTHTGPRTPGDPVQSFPTDMFQLAGNLPPGDPDFQSLQIIAGTGFGLPSPGQTTLTRLGPPGSDFQVDSFFDITYQINFVGAPGGVLAGLGGTTEGGLRVDAAGESDPCLVDDDGTGTVELPPPGCDYLSPQEVHMIIDGLPPGTEIELDPRHTRFICEVSGCGVPGGTFPGGEVEDFGSTLVLQLARQGNQSFRRTLRVPATVQTHTGPRGTGAVQSFPTDMFSLLGALPPGDPDFDSLVITAGTGNGLPSPGHTTLTQLPSGNWNVDSFFDITYQIDFVGAPGGALEGLSGSTTSLVRVDARGGKTDSVEEDNGLGTVTVPPEGGEYVSPDEVHMIIEGLPAGTTIELDPSHWSFFCDTTPCSVTGGGLGGGTELFTSTLEIELRGTGSLAGFQRNLQIDTSVQTDTGPRSPGAPVQEFDTEMVSLQGAMPPGDPDFAQLTITAGSANGLPSPGHTTLTDQGDGSFVVDSFFDITYQIDFVGAPGGQLEGMSGSTQGDIRVTACDREGAPAHNISIIKEADPPDGTDFSFTGLSSFSLDDDGNATLPDRRTFNNLTAGTKTVTETVPSDWTLVSITCDDPDGGTTVDLAAAEASIDLDIGEAITCTFKNVRTLDLIFVDGFESGDTSRWSLTFPPAP